MKDGTGDWRLMGCSAEQLHQMMQGEVGKAERPSFRVIQPGGAMHEQPDRPLDSTAAMLGWDVEIVPPVGATWMMHMLERVFGVTKETDPAELDGRLAHLIDFLTEWRSDIAARSASGSVITPPASLHKSTLGAPLVDG